MNTITQIYDEHASMPPHDEKKSENLINYLLHDGECVLMRSTALHFLPSSLINSSFRLLFFSFFFEPREFARILRDFCKITAREIERRLSLGNH
jgi:hypothetical protein